MSMHDISSMQIRLTVHLHPNTVLGESERQGFEIGTTEMLTYSIRLHAE